MVYVVATPDEAKKLEDEGKLLYLCFGSRYKSFPEAGRQEPLREGNGSYVQDFSWLRIGWLTALAQKDSNIGTPQAMLSRYSTSIVPLTKNIHARISQTLGHSTLRGTA